MNSYKQPEPFYRFIADVHLGANPVMIKQFCHLISETPASCKGLYILGDLFDHWLGSDIHETTYRELQDCFKALPFPVYFLPGNRDFLLEDQWLEKAGITRIHDPYTLQIREKNIILTHGDQFCTNDSAYQWYRWLVRKPLSQAIFRKLPKSFRLFILGMIRKNGKSTTSSTQKANRYNINLTRNLEATLLMGHVHHPSLDHSLVVLPDWRRKDRCGFLDLEHTSMKMSLSY